MRMVEIGRIGLIRNIIPGIFDEDGKIKIGINILITDGDPEFLTKPVKTVIRPLERNIYVNLQRCSFYIPIRLKQIYDLPDATVWSVDGVIFKDMIVFYSEDRYKNRYFRNIIHKTNINLCHQNYTNDDYAEIVPLVYRTSITENGVIATEDFIINKKEWKGNIICTPRFGNLEKCIYEGIIVYPYKGYSYAIVKYLDTEDYEEFISKLPKP